MSIGLVATIPSKSQHDSHKLLIYTILGIDYDVLYDVIIPTSYNSLRGSIKFDPHVLQTKIYMQHITIPIIQSDITNTERSIYRAFNIRYVKLLVDNSFVYILSKFRNSFTNGMMSDRPTTLISISLGVSDILRVNDILKLIFVG